MKLKVEGMMLSPGYSYQKAPDQEHFLGRERTKKLFQEILNQRKNPGNSISPQLPRIPPRQRGLRLHTLGQPHLQCLWLAETLLPTPRRLRPDLQTVNGRHRLGKLRPEERQREVPRLHGPLRLRSQFGR